MYRDKNYLVHAKGKGKGSKYGPIITVNGRPNNSPEYNHNYYLFNKEKWVNIYNKAKSAAKEAGRRIGNTAYQLNPNSNSVTKGTAKGSGGMPTNVRNKYTNTENLKRGAKGAVNNARERARLTLDSAGAAVERARQAAKGYGAKIHYKVGEARRRIGNAAYQLNPNSNSVTKGTARGSSGMPSNVRARYTNTENLKRGAKDAINAAGKRVNAARDAAVDTFNDVRREAGRRLNNARYYANPNANKTTRGLNAAGMPSNVRARYTNTENLKRGAKDALNNAGRRVNAARDAAGRIIKEAGRRAGNAAYRLNPNGNDVTRGRTAAGMPSNVRSRYTNTENLKRGAKDAINAVGRRANEARDAAGRLLKEAGRQAGNAAYRLNPNGNDITRGRRAAGMPSNVRARYTNTENLKRGAKDAVNAAGRRVNAAKDAVNGTVNDWKAKASDKLNQAGQAALERIVSEVVRQVNAGVPTNEISEYSAARKQLKDIGLSPKQIANTLGLIGGSRPSKWKDQSGNNYDPYANMPASNKAKAQQMDSFVKDVQDGLRRTGMSINDLLKSQSFDLTLAEFGGYDPDKLSADEKRIMRAELIKKLRK